MSIARRIEELEQAAYRAGFDALKRRMTERLRGKSEAEITAARAMLEHYMRTGEVMPGLLEILQEMTAP